MEIHSLVSSLAIIPLYHFWHHLWCHGCDNMHSHCRPQTAVPKIVTDNFLTKDWCCYCWALMRNLHSHVCMVFHVFPFLSVFMALWGLCSSGYGLKVPPHLSVLNEVSLSRSDLSSHQLPWWCHHQLFLERCRRLILGSKRDVAPVSPRMHFSYMTWILLGWTLAAWWR